MDDEYFTQLRQRAQAKKTAIPATQISPEEQKQKFGGEVGSQEYYETKAKDVTVGKEFMKETGAGILGGAATGFAVAGPAGILPGALFGGGIQSKFNEQLPPQEEWDKMTTGAKIGAVTYAGIAAPASFLWSLPKTIAQGAASFGISSLKPFYNQVTGKPYDWESLAKEKPVNVPLLGEIPTVFNNYEENKKLGFGEVASTLFATSRFALDGLVAGEVLQGLGNTFKPRSKLASGETIKDIAPISKAIVEDVNGNFKMITKPEGMVSEYYTMPKTEAKKWQGTTEDTKWKFTPAGEGKTNLSIVKNVNKKVGETIQTEFGLKTVEQGDWGPEIKLYSQDVPTGKAIPEIKPTEGVSIPKERIFVRPASLKGLENKPVTAEQLGEMESITKATGIDPAVRDAAIRTITGKKNLGELTQKEYVDAAQAVALFGQKYMPAEAKLGPMGWVRAWISPQRHFADYVEDTYGIPYKSKVYVPMEEGMRLANNLSDSLMEDINGIFGKFANSKYVEERRLIDGYMRGNKSVITDNPALDVATKSELISVADNFRGFLNKVGPSLDVPFEIYIKDYLPNIQDIGGVVLKYKNLEEVPGKKTFFAKEKRTGNILTNIDDPLAVGHIYARQGARALHLGKVLEESKSIIESTSNKDIAKQMNSYVQEKMGYSGSIEKFIDGFVPAINSKLGTSLPKDFSRQMVNMVLSSFYSGVLSGPASAFKQMFQLPTFVYAKLGPKFLSEATTKAFSSTGKAEFAKTGFGMDISVPYGEELAKGSVTGRAANLMKKGTQTLISPLTYVDNGIRRITYFQGKAIFEDALAKYNGGKIQWSQFEDMIDMKNFSRSDRNIIRQRLMKGDIEGAFNNYIRETIDETSFPYRTGSGARIGYGLGGKLGTGLMNYTIESGNVLGKWVANKQWDKVTRFAVGSKVTYDYLKDLGFDFYKTLAIYPQVGDLMSPAVKLLVDIVEGIKAKTQSNDQAFEENIDEIARTAMSSVPAGVFGQNVARFAKSYRAGPDANGKYTIFNDQGKAVYQGSFSDLYWGTLMGFPINEKVAEGTLYANILNKTYEERKTKEKIDTLLREGKYDEMEKMIMKTGITPSQNAMESYYVPRVQKTFQNLSPKLKAEFAPKIIR